MRIRAMETRGANLLSLIRYLTEREDSDGPAVLVVGDEPLIRMNIAATFEDAGRRNLWFARKFRISQSECVRKRWPPTVIVICSGNNLTDLRPIPPDIDFLPKPYEMNTMARVVKGVFAKVSDFA